MKAEFDTEPNKEQVTKSLVGNAARGGAFWGGLGQKHSYQK